MKKIDVAKTLSDIREQVRKDYSKKQEELQLTMLPQPLELGELYKNLDDTNSNWNISPPPVIVSEGKKGPAVKFLKKCIRKLIRWYVNPLFEKQNTFNASVTRSLNEIKKNLEAIDREIQKRGNVLSNVNERISAAINERISAAVDLSVINVLESSNKINDALTQTLEIIRQSGSNEILLNKAVSLFKKKAIYDLSTQIPPSNIVLLCQNFKTDRIIEAIKKEAWTLFLALKKGPMGDYIKFVSLEQTVDKLDYSESQDVYYCPYDNLEELLKELNPSVIHVFETNAFLLFTDNRALLNSNLVATLSGINPIEGIDNPKMTEIQHQMEHGSLVMVTESQYSKHMCKENNLPAVELIYPVIDNIDSIASVGPKTKVGSGSKAFCVGFASSPMNVGQSKDRGIDLLLQAAKELPNVTFLLVWRNPEVNIEDKITELGLKNITLKTGFVDMSQFYSSIDCLILPYSSRHNNHASPLSALEATVEGIPVICTNMVGISNIIEYENMGVVVEPKVNSIVKGISGLLAQEIDRGKIQKNALAVFSNSQTVSAYTNIYRRLWNQKPAMPLLNWQIQVKQDGKELVKGRENLSKYYQSLNIAQEYTPTRFTEFPMNCYDIFEREAINLLISGWRKPGVISLKLLDVATGDGRILQELLRYGQCTAIDSSSEMLKIAQSRYSETGDLEIKVCDFFDYDSPTKFDVITSFRYLRHFDYGERAVIYKRIQKLLENGGIVIFDYPNRVAELVLREKMGWQKFNVYDVFWSLDSLKREVNENGFEIVNYIPVGEGLLAELDGPLVAEPLIWVVGLRKINPAEGE